MNTFYIKADNIDEDILKKRGNWKKYQKGNHINFLYIEKSQYAPIKKFYYKNIDIENRLLISDSDKYTVVEKFLKSKTRGEKNLVSNQILINISKPDYIIKAYLNFIKDNKIYILKPVKGHAKKGIEIIEEKKDFKKIYNNIKKNKNYDLWTLQEYITNPLLYLKKKFHFRCFFIVTNQEKFYLYTTFWIFRAKDKYRKEDYKNKDIHITKYNEIDEKIKNKLLINRKNRGAFSEEEFNIIEKNIIKIHKKLKNKLTIKCYTDKNCFQILGTDIMFTEDYKPKLLEVNKSPDFSKPMMKTTQQPILEGIMQEIIDKKFPPKIKPEKNNYLIKL